MGLISRVSSRTYRSTILDMDKKNKQMLKNQSQPKITHHAIPDEARVMKQILEELGITDYDPQVVTQMLDFSYGYLTEVLSDSQAFAKHRDCGAIDIEDVKLATKNKQERSKRGSSLLPSRSTVSKVATKRNEKPLDAPKSDRHMPPVRFCYNEENYEMEPLPPPDMGQPQAPQQQQPLENNQMTDQPVINNYAMPQNPTET